MFDATNKELKLFKNLLEYLNILVVHWLVKQVIETKPTRDDQHQTLVKFCRNLKQNLVVVLELQAIILNVINHSGLLLVEKLPHFQNIFQVVSSNLVKVPLLGGQLFLVLLFQNLEVEIKESLDFRSVLRLQRIYVRKKLVESCQKPLV